MKNNDSSNFFYVIPEFQDSYRTNIFLGSEYLKTKDVAILGLCRNIEHKAHNLLGFLEKFSSISKSLDIFMYENDSEDNTPNILKDYQRNNGKFAFVSEKLNRKFYGQTKEKDRVLRLAEYRNKCLDYAKEFFQDKDYILVIDTDFLDFSIDGILNSFGHISINENIDAVCGFSYQIKHIMGLTVPWNYDSWAYRQNWWEDQHKYMRSFDPMLWFGFWFPPIGSPLIKINSGFGGSCIYKTKKMLRAEYSSDDCEHVCFHKNLLEKNDQFKLYANPSQIMLLDVILEK